MEYKIVQKNVEKFCSFEHVLIIFSVFYHNLFFSVQKCIKLINNKQVFYNIINNKKSIKLTIPSCFLQFVRGYYYCYYFFYLNKYY